MRSGPVRRALRGGLGRRRVQTAVIGLVLLVTTGAAVLALAVVADSNAPFDAAFAAQRGADITATINPARASPARLAATRRLPQIVAAAGPFAEVTTSLQLTIATAGPAGSARLLIPSVTLVGRAAPDGPVDDIALQSGHWPTGPGQIVLSGNQAGSSLPVQPSPGMPVTAVGAAGKPELTVVGIASSVTGTADGWVTPAEITRLTTPQEPASTQMLYRFRAAGDDAAVRADAAAVAGALPPGAVTAIQSYLPVRLQETLGIAPIAPFVAAFGIIGLAMSVLIVANVVSGSVVSGYRRIGVLKSIGFTPGQVSAAYAGQALIPAAAGCTAGVLAGNLLSGALLGRAASVYQVGTLGVPSWVNLSVPAAMLVVVGIAALVPAIRAGRLSAIRAIAAGRAPRSGGGYGAHRLLGRLPVVRPVTIGLAASFARPARTAVTLVATLLGAAAVTFAVGLGASLTRVESGLSLAGTEQVFVSLPTAPGSGVSGVRMGAGGAQSTRVALLPKGVRPAAPAAAEHAVAAALRAQPGTAHFVAETDQQVTVAGLAQQIPVTAFRGDAGWTGYQMISGRWYTGPGQVVVPTHFLTVTGKSLGNPVSFTFGGRQITARIVGEVFDGDNSGLAMITAWQTLASADPRLAQTSQYDVELRSGTSAPAYVQALSTALGPAYGVSLNGAGRGLPLVLGLIDALTLLLGAVAGLGVLNTVVLQTRERVHDLGVFKAIGMTPRQTVVMIVCWVAGIGLVAGLIAVPLGIALQRYLVPVMASAAGTALPASILDVYGGWQLGGLALAGMAIAVAGSLAPAVWAASARTETALRAE
jgi:putative ABC transport system permease protein